MKSYYVDISTDQYTGNFERDMCAYITGVVGDCGVGDDMIIHVPPDVRNMFEDALEQRPDEHGCFRPVKCLGPEKQNDLRIYFEVRPTEKMMETIRQRAGIFAANQKALDPRPGYENRPDLKVLKVQAYEEETTVSRVEI